MAGKRGQESTCFFKFIRLGVGSHEGTQKLKIHFYEENNDMLDVLFFWGFLGE